MAGMGNVSEPNTLAIYLSLDGVTYTEEAAWSPSHVAAQGNVWVTHSQDREWTVKRARYVRIDMTNVANKWIFLGTVEVPGAPCYLIQDANLVWSGDSQTEGVTWVDQVIARQAVPPLSAANMAVSGKQIYQLLTDDVSRVDPLFVAGRTNVLLNTAGINDLRTGRSVAQLQADLQTYADARRAVGWKVLLGTLTPTTYAGTPGTYEADRLLVNTWMRAQGSGLCDGLIDVGGQAVLGVVGNTPDARYYWDLLHFTNLAFAMVASLAHAQLAAVGLV
jgi:hypothetical protein